MASVSENNPMRRLGSVMSLTDDCDQDINRVPNWHIFSSVSIGTSTTAPGPLPVRYPAESTGNHVNDYSELCFM